MRYAKFGPFDIGIARAISSSDPVECVEFWGDKTVLEGAGSSILTLGYNDEYMGSCNSHHFGGHLSTINYEKAKMILCQIDEPISGIFICEENVVPYFQKGFGKLLEERLNPESELNRTLNERKEYIRERLKKINPAVLATHVKTYLENSKILERDDVEVLKRTRTPEPRYIDSLEPFLRTFYSQQYLGRAMHIGMVLNYFGLPTGHLEKHAKKEIREMEKDNFTTLRSRVLFEAFLLKEQWNGSLFSLV